MRSVENMLTHRAPADEVDILPREPVSPQFLHEGPNSPAFPGSQYNSTACHYAGRARNFLVHDK